MTQLSFDKTRTNLKNAGIIQLVAAVFIASGTFLPSVFGTPYPVVSVVAGILGLFVAISGAVSLFLASRYPMVKRFSLIALLSLVLLAIAGNGGGIAIMLLTEPTVLGIIIGAVIIVVTFGVGLASIGNPQAVKAAKEA